MSSHGERTIKKTQHTCKKQRNIHKAKGFAVIPTDVLQNCFVLDARTRTHNAERRPSGPARTKKRFLSKHVCGGNCKKMSANGEGTNKKANTHAKSKQTQSKRLLQSPRQMCCKMICVGRRAGAHAHTTHNARRPGPRARAPNFGFPPPRPRRPNTSYFLSTSVGEIAKQARAKRRTTQRANTTRQKNKQT